jgi:hypothetical protein
LPQNNGRLRVLKPGRAQGFNQPFDICAAAKSRSRPVDRGVFQRRIQPRKRLKSPSRLLDLPEPDEAEDFGLARCQNFGPSRFARCTQAQD